MKKILLLGFIFFIFAIPLTSFGEEEGCGDEGECIEGNCENGLGTYVFTDGSSYSGDWKDGFPEGSGTLKFTDGSKQDGKWKDGFPEGPGTLKYIDGSILKGKWKSGMFNGKMD
jgi:hypothetical protein